MDNTEDNKKILLDRTVDRGLKEGRFVSMDGNYGIVNKIQQLEAGYNQFKDELKINNYTDVKTETEEKTNRIILFKYKSNFNAEIYEKILAVPENLAAPENVVPIIQSQIIENQMYRKIS